MKRLLLLILLLLHFTEQENEAQGGLELSPRSCRERGMQPPASPACEWGRQMKTVLSASSRHVCLMHVHLLWLTLQGPCPLPHLSLQVCFPETWVPGCKVSPHMRAHPDGAAA